MLLENLVDPRAFLLACSEYRSSSTSDRKKLSEPEKPSAVDMGNMPSVAKVLDGEMDRISHKNADKSPYNFNISLSLDIL